MRGFCGPWSKTKEVSAFLFRNFRFPSRGSSEGRFQGVFSGVKQSTISMFGTSERQRKTGH